MNDLTVLIGQVNAEGPRIILRCQPDQNGAVVAYLLVDYAGQFAGGSSTNMFHPPTGEVGVIDNHAWAFGTAAKDCSAVVVGGEMATLIDRTDMNLMFWIGELGSRGGTHEVVFVSRDGSTKSLRVHRS